MSTVSGQPGLRGVDWSMIAGAKFLCTCGRQISTSGSIPNPIEWHLIADRDFDIDRDATDLMGRSVLAWICAGCGRLWVESGPVNDPSRSPALWEYVPAFDSEGPLRSQ